MDLSVIIVSYNTRELLKECLESIHAAEPQVEYEVIVVDNNSSDGSPDMVRSRFPEVVVQANPENLGFSAACNQGIRLSTGRYVLLLNSDTVVLPGCFDRLVQFADSHPNAGVVGCSHLSPSGKMVTCFAYGFLFSRPATSRKVKALRNGWVSGACMLLRRRACEEVGGLDEDFFFGSEDLELCWRILKKGWKVYYTPDAQIIHYGAMSSGRGFNPRTYYEAKRGSGLLMKKHGTAVHRLVWSLLIWLQLIPDLVAAVSTGQTERITVCLKVFRMSLLHDFRPPASG
ncbi:MAG: glycosyltransferase family 2 protein [Bacillota bacterium]|nr:glycosyltransferase family 2 protein [Bacillota bacterium]